MTQWFSTYIEEIYTPQIESMFSMENQAKFDTSIKSIIYKVLSHLKIIQPSLEKKIQQLLTVKD